MHNEERSGGGLMTRRQLVTRWRTAAAAAVTGRERSAAASVAGATAGRTAGGAVVAPDCVAQPQQTEGPYFVDKQLARQDIRVDPATGEVSAGVPLQLRLVLSRVTAAGACALLRGAQVDIWHCDAAGIYSAVRDRRSDSTGRKFLRGYQMSDAAGEVRFVTIYPGWYPGRAVHIHFKVRVPAANGRVDEFTSQLYFDDALTDRVHREPAYAANRGQRLLNERDMVFRGGGTRLILPVAKAGDGYQATFSVAMRPASA